VHHEEAADAGGTEPGRDRACTGGVVRHEPHERLPAEPDEGGDRRDLQQIGLSEERSDSLDLRGVEVADVGEARWVLTGPPGVGQRALLPVEPVSVERDELGLSGT
jgi:hypothetical protein